MAYTIYCNQVWQINAFNDNIHKNGTKPVVANLSIKLNRNWAINTDPVEIYIIFVLSCNVHVCICMPTSFGCFLRVAALFRLTLVGVTRDVLAYILVFFLY